MSLTLELPADLETELVAEASQLGVALPEYVLRLLTGGRIPKVAPKTGAELLSYWQSERLVGTRENTVDASALARTLRDAAQKRARP